ncbi:MAG: hypothetical protein ABIQ52_04735 [Vicinamibacterales bacterium]
MSEDGGRSSEARGRTDARWCSEAGGRTDARLDLAIDRAVRELLDVEPPAGLRGRVMQRIDALSPNPVASAFGRKLAWLALPIAAAAILVLTVLAPWRSAAPAEVPPRLASSAQSEPSEAQGELAAPRAVVTPPVPPVTPSASRRAPAGPSAATPVARVITPSTPLAVPAPPDHEVVAAVALPDAAGGIGELAAIAPIAIANIRPSAIISAEISIAPLPPLAEVHIAPLSPPDRRN